MTRLELLEIAKPIPFNDKMVLAIKNNNKTVTRRKVKPQPPKEANGIYERMDNGNFHMKISPYESIYDYEIIPPYQVGDYLYVQETWSEDKHNYLYRADFPYEDLEKLKNIMRWGSPKCMPRKAARIFLRVTDVRVERLQDITSEQICREGIICEEPYILNGIEKRYAFQSVWNSTVKKSDLARYGWDANPWVLVVEFEKVEVE